MERGRETGLPKDLYEFRSMAFGYDPRSTKKTGTGFEEFRVLMTYDHSRGEYSHWFLGSDVRELLDLKGAPVSLANRSNFLAYSLQTGFCKGVCGRLGPALECLRAGGRVKARFQDLDLYP